MALKKQATPKRWRSKEAKEIVAAVQRAGGQGERTASGHLKVIGPAGSAIVASAPNTGRAVGGRSTTPWPRSEARPGWRCETLGRAWPPPGCLKSQPRNRCLRSAKQPGLGPAAQRRNQPSTRIFACRHFPLL